MQHFALSHPYRAIAGPAADEEVVALARLAARARRARRAVGVPILCAGLVLGGLGYAVVRDVAFAAIDARAPCMALLFTMFPLFVMAQALAAYAGRKTVEANSRRWIAEIAFRSDVCPSLLEAFARVL
jgi:hypothetical protein